MKKIIGKILFGIFITAGFCGFLWPLIIGDWLYFVVITLFCVFICCYIALTIWLLK